MTWIAQLSDPHVVAPGTLYHGVADSNAALAAAVARVNALDPPPDLVLLSGDVTEHGTPAEYAHARSILAALRAPLLAIPGNHDERETFRAAFADQPGLPAAGPLHWVQDAGPVRVIGFDVTVPGAHHGLADDAALAWLDAALAAAPGRPTLVMQHQQPLACGVPYIDAYRCHGADALDALLRRHPQVERLLCGHVHRAMARRFGGTLLLTAPSTATTIALQPRPDARPSSHLDPPGLLLHHWDGAALLSHLVAIGDFPGPFPFC